MLRHYDQHGGGVRVYTHRILRAMLDSNTPHEFVFLYKNPALAGTYAAEPRVTEAVLPGKNGPVVLVDAGANVDCRPEWLMQFGLMGAAFFLFARAYATARRRLATRTLTPAT